MAETRDAAAAVKAARGRKGVTIPELAKLTGLSRAGIWRIEQGEREPTVSTLTEIARACDGRFTITRKGIRYVP